MRRKSGYKKLIFFTRLTFQFLFIAFAVLLLLEREKPVYSFASVTDKNGSEVKQGDTQEISFANKFVRTGQPLEVSNAPEASVYQWTITGADGSARAFITEVGSYTPTEEDREKLITVTVSGKSTSIYFSSLPVLYITSKEGYYSVGDDFSEAAMYLQGNEAFSEGKRLYKGNIKIKLRGNSTKKRDKRPFNIKLDSKADLLSLGVNKHFALLANDIDHTLLRNKLLYDFSAAIGMEVYSKSENVVLI